MKKILLVLSVFVLLSCEQEDLNNLVDNSKVETGQQSAVKGRAASTIADFDPITELKDIPVNIINVGTDHADASNIVEVAFNAFRTESGPLPGQLFGNAGGFFQPGGNGADRVALVAGFKFHVQYIKLCLNLFHCTGIHHHQLFIIHNYPHQVSGLVI